MILNSFDAPATRDEINHRTGTLKLFFDGFTFEADENGWRAVDDTNSIGASRRTAAPLSNLQAAVMKITGKNIPLELLK